MTDQPHSEADWESFQRLDACLQALRDGNADRLEQLLEQHPELRETLACLAALEGLATPGQVNSPANANDADATVRGKSEHRSQRESTFSSLRALPAAFGKFLLEEELGRGGMGIVYRARQRDLGRTVAVKMILASQLASDEEVRRFYREAESAGRLRHPHIVGIHEVGELNGQHYFSMDYICGQSLARLIAQGPLAPEVATRKVLLIARAVDYLHSQGVLHRDLKPSNIMIDGEGQPYVTDFGLAKIADDAGATQTGTILGTPEYMPPEQAAGRTAEVSVRSDVYSLGAILYACLTGRPPFQERTPLDTLVQVLEGEPTLPRRLRPAIPRALELICLRCLEKNPADRYASAAELADDLERYLKGDPITTRAAGVGEWLRRWWRREPALVSRLAGLAAATAVLQVNYQLRGTDLSFHLTILLIIAAWAVASFIFQQLLNRPRTSNLARFAWVGVDIALLTTLLEMADGPIGSLLIGYPLLVVASGLFFRIRLIWFATLISLLCYGGLIGAKGLYNEPAHYPLIFAVTLIVLGGIVAYQVNRVRALSRFFEQRMDGL